MAFGLFKLCVCRAQRVVTASLYGNGADLKRTGHTHHISICHGAGALFHAFEVEGKPRVAWFMANRRQWVGDKLTQTAHGTFDSRVVR